MKSTRVFGSVAITSVVMLSACGSGGGSGASGPVNIGVATALSGPYGTSGTELLLGAEAGAYVVNHHGGIMGRQVNTIGVDTAWDTIDAIPAVRKMLAVDNVSAEVGMGALDYTDALPILNQAKMVSFNILGTPAVDHLVMPYSWSVKISDAIEGAAMAWLANSRGYKKIALVFDAASGSQSFIPPITSAAGKLGLSIVAQPTVPESAPSYEPEIQQILQAHPDAVLMQLEPPQVGAFFSDWKTLGATNIPVIASDFSVDTDWADAAGAAEITNHVVGVQALADVAGPGGQDFVNAYQTLFHKAPPFFAALGYDGVTLAALAMNAAKSTDPTVYNSYIQKVTEIAPGHITCDTYGSCAGLVKAGDQVKFIGVNTPFNFNQYHRVSADFGAFVPPLSASALPALVTTIRGLDLTGLF